MWPIFYMVFFFVFVLSQILASFPSGPSQEMPDGFLLIFPLHFFTMILMVVLLVIYIKNVFRNDRVAQDKKALWAVVLFIGNMIAMPIYYYLYIWREPEREQLTK